MAETAKSLRDEIEKLHNFILEINAMEDIDQVIDIITDYIKAEFGFEFYWLLFVDHKCFSYFDRVVERFNLEKMKTIGDSYMCAGGIPTPNFTHPVDAVLAALEIKNIMDQIREIKETQEMPYWTLRLGIHTGPLVAGVIGENKFAYDIWGDTVNMASRMESHGEPTKINISASTYEAVREFFDCEYRGNIYVKSKGEAEMYFVTGIKPALSINGLRRAANDDFQKMYSDLRRGRKPSAPPEVESSLIDTESSRLKSRVTPADPGDFSVEFFIEGRPIIARLGNISEEGLCFFIAESGPGFGDRLEGFILDKPAGERIPYQAEVVWTYRGFLEGNMYLFVGLQFKAPVSFTGSLRRLAGEAPLPVK